MKVRLLEKKDIKEAQKIVGRNYSKEDMSPAGKEMRDMFGKSAFKPVYFVAEDHGKIIGFAGYIQSWIDYSVYQIFWVNVIPEMQKKGIGKKLIRRLISEIRKKKDAHMIQLSANQRTNGYYRKNFGFKTVDKFGPKPNHLMTLAPPKSRKK